MFEFLNKKWEGGYSMTSDYFNVLMNGHSVFKEITYERKLKVIFYIKIVQNKA